jgi:hypothetical protein
MPAMKERVTSEERLQFIKLFGLTPDIMPQYGDTSFELVAFNAEQGYGRFVDPRIDPNTLGEKQALFMAEYQVLDRESGAYAIRQGNCRLEVTWPRFPVMMVHHIENGMATIYEPDYLSSRYKVDDFGDDTDEVISAPVIIAVKEQTRAAEGEYLLEASYQDEYIYVQLNEKGEKADVKNDEIDPVAPVHFEEFLGPRFTIPFDDPNDFMITTVHKADRQQYDFAGEYGEFFVFSEEATYAYKIDRTETTYSFSIDDLTSYDRTEITIPSLVNFWDMHRQVNGETWMKTREHFPVIIK